jgi:hypothetical protein
MKECFIYVMAASRDDGMNAPVKVGISADPQKRLASINTAAPFRVALYRSFRLPNRFMAQSVERVFHSVNGGNRLNGEWFQIEPEQAVQSLAFGFAVAYIEVMKHPPERIQAWFDFVQMPEAVYVDAQKRCWGGGFAGEPREQ